MEKNAWKIRATRFNNLPPIGIFNELPRKMQSDYDSLVNAMKAMLSVEWRKACKSMHATLKVNPKKFPDVQHQERQ